VKEKDVLEVLLNKEADRALKHSTLLILTLHPG